LAELPFVVWLDRSYRRRQEDYFAAKLGEPLRCPEWVVGSINDAAMVAQLRELAPDVICVFGSSILRAPTIQCARRGVLNLHSGLLPEYRGAKSEFWALANGEFDRVGATVHFIDEGVDTGPIVARTVVPVAADDDDRSLRCKTIEAGVEAVLQTLDRMATGNVESFPQRRAEGKAYSTPTLPAYFRLKRNLRRRALAAGR
jgi:methionyl-tRNA formyltransferase